MNISNEEEAIAQFCAAVKLHTEATETGNSRNANKAYLKIVTVLHWLQRHQVTGLLYPLLDSHDVGTQLWAASYFLSSGNAKAAETLTALAGLNNIHGFTARITLREWYAGRLKPLA